MATETTIEQLMAQACVMLDQASHPHFTNRQVNVIIQALKNVRGDEKVDVPEGTAEE